MSVIVLLLLWQPVTTAAASPAATSNVQRVLIAGASGLRRRGRKLARLAARAEAHPVVRAVAERLLRGLPAAAERHHGASCETPFPAALVLDRDGALEAERAVVPDRDLEVGHEAAILVRCEGRGKLGRMKHPAEGEEALAHEYAAGRERAALVTLARGTLDVTGPKRQDFLHSMLSNEVKGLGPGQGRRAASMSAKGSLQ